MNTEHDMIIIPKFPYTITYEHTILPPLIIEHAIRLKILLLLYANHSTIESLFIAHWIVYRLIVFECCHTGNLNSETVEFLDEIQLTSSDIIQHLLPIHSDDFEILFRDEIDKPTQQFVIATTLIACFIAEKLVGSEIVFYAEWKFWRLNVPGIVEAVWEREVLRYFSYHFPVITDTWLLYENRESLQITTHDILTSLFDRNRFTNRFLLSDEKYESEEFVVYRSYILNRFLVRQHRIYEFTLENIHKKKLNFSINNNQVDDSDIVTIEL